MTQYEVFEKLLEKTGISAYQVSKDTGISTQSLSAWKKRNGSTNFENLKKIAKVFNVDVSIFSSNGENNNDEDEAYYYLDEETREYAETLRTNKEMKLLFDAAQTASKEDLEMVANLLMRMKKEEKNNE